MEINKSGYYYWLKNKEQKKNYQIKRLELIELVEAIHKKRPSYGYRRINATIKLETGLVVSDNQVHKCCKYLEIKSEIKHYKYKRIGQESVIYPNLVKGNWQVSRPFELIVSDTTAMYFKGQGIEWTYYIDVFNNEIVASSIGQFKYGNNVPIHYKALKQLIKNKIKRGYKHLETTLHTDQGAIYSSKDFQQIHKDYNIIRSMSRAGTPTDNPIIESLNGWIKMELKTDINKNDFNNLTDFENYIINYFNCERPSYKLKYKTPIQFRTELGFN
jgi:transposase InsO family protein